MKRIFEFTGSACHGCEYNVRNGALEESQVIWQINCYMILNESEKKHRTIGWMTGEQIERYAKQRRVYMSPSSTICPPCSCSFLGLHSICDLEERLKRKIPRDLDDAENINHVLLGYKRFEKFLQSQKEKNDC